MRRSMLFNLSAPEMEVLQIVKGDPETTASTIHDKVTDPFSQRMNTVYLVKSLLERKLLVDGPLPEDVVTNGRRGRVYSLSPLGLRMLEIGDHVVKALAKPLKAPPKPRAAKKRVAA